MEIEFMQQQIEVAKEQTAISFRKSQQKKDKGDMEGYMVYLTRAHAFRELIKKRQAEINKRIQKQAKKVKDGKRTCVA